MVNEYELLIREKLEFFMDEKILVHISLKDGSFYNGELIKQVRDGVYWLEDREDGEIFIFVGDVKSCDQFKEKKEESDT